MELKPDCVRDTLFMLEKELTIDFQQSNFNSISLADLTEKMLLNHTYYTAEDIWYTVYNLIQIHFIEGRFSNAGNHKMMFCDIENITFSGHQFLNTIRPQTIWEATLEKAKKIGGMSIGTISMVSSSVMQGVASNPDFIQSIVNMVNNIKT